MMQVTVNGQVFQKEESTEAWDIIRINERQWHVLHKDQSYKLNLLQWNEEEKTMQLEMNGKIFNVGIKDKYDLLLQQMGMSNNSAQKMKLLKAPMPGLVVKILVKEGDQIQKGDNLLVLEAMKMENMIKAAGDGRVKKISVQERTAVEKNQLLLEME